MKNKIDTLYYSRFVCIGDRILHDIFKRKVTTDFTVAADTDNRSKDNII